MRSWLGGALWSKVSLYVILVPSDRVTEGKLHYKCVSIKNPQISVSAERMHLIVRYPVGYVNNT